MNTDSKFVVVVVVVVGGARWRPMGEGPRVRDLELVQSSLGT